MILRVVHPPRELDAPFFTTRKKKRKKNETQHSARGAFLQKRGTWLWGEKKPSRTARQISSLRCPLRRRHLHTRTKRGNVIPWQSRQSLSLNSQLVKGPRAETVNASRGDVGTGAVMCSRPCRPHGSPSSSLSWWLPSPDSCTRTNTHTHQHHQQRQRQQRGG